MDRHALLFCPHGGRHRLALPRRPPPLLSRRRQVFHALPLGEPGPRLSPAGASGHLARPQRGGPGGASAPDPAGGRFPLGGGGAGRHGLPGGQPEPGVSLRHGDGQGEGLRLPGLSRGAGPVPGGDLLPCPCGGLRQDPAGRPGAGGVPPHSGDLQPVPHPGAHGPPEGAEGLLPRRRPVGVV